MNAVDMQQIVSLAFQVMLGLIGFFAVMVLKNIQKSIADMDKSINELNVRVAVLLEKNSAHQHELLIHENRIKEIECFIKEKAPCQKHEFALEHLVQSTKRS